MKTSKPLLLAAAGFVVLVSLVVFTQTHHDTNPRSSTLDSEHSVTLNWQPTVGAGSYCIYRSTTRGSGYQLIGTSEKPTYDDTPVPSEAVFYYVVTSVVKGRESKYSSEIKAEVPR